MKTHRLLSAIVGASTVLAQAPPAISIGVQDAPTPVDPRIKQVIVGGFQPAATAGGQPVPVLAFTPETVTAQPGDTIRFTFLGTNHSVVQTSFEAPCQPAPNGFNSGPKPNPNNDLTTAPTMDLPVTAPGPLYMSVLETQNCGVGMVLTVNAPPESQPGSHTLFKAAAIAAGNPGLKAAAIAAGPQAPQIMSTVSIQVGNAAAQPTGAGGPGTVVQGTGRTSNGQPCSCRCLCGGSVAAAPAGAGMGSFGGIVGQMPPAAAAAGAMSPANMAPMRFARALANDRYKSPLY